MIIVLRAFVRSCVVSFLFILEPIFGALLGDPNNVCFCVGVDTKIALSKGICIHQRRSFLVNRRTKT